MSPTGLKFILCSTSGGVNDIRSMPSDAKKKREQRKKDAAKAKDINKKTKVQNGDSNPSEPIQNGHGMMKYIKKKSHLV